MIRASRGLLIILQSLDAVMEGGTRVTRRQPQFGIMPFLGLGLLALGGIAFYKPDETRETASEIATVVSSKAIELWTAAGWREVAKAPAASTSGYRAPQRFVKSKQSGGAVAKQSSESIHPASFDDAAGNEDDSQRPQVKAPTLDAPENKPGLRQLGIGTGPKLKPAPPTEGSLGKPNAATPEMTGPAKSGLNAPEVHKVRNPYAMKISDEGQAKSQNENALLQGEGASPGLLPEKRSDEELPIGSGIAPEKLKNKEEKSVLKNRITTVPRPPIVPAKEPEKVPVRSEPSSEADTAPAETPSTPATKPRPRPSTAILLDAAPPQPAPSGSPALEAPKAETENQSGTADPKLLSAKTTEPLDHHASNYLGVTPGVSDEKAALAALGTPISTTNDGQSRVLRFSSETFAQVQVDLIDGTVESVTLSLQRPLPTKEIVKELGLAVFEPGQVTSGDGYVLGQVYPERGVMLQFAQADNGVTEVELIELQRVQAEPFLLRALDDKSHRYESAFRDLEIALSLDPEEPRALWLKANLLSELGKHISALRTIDDAIRLDPTAAGYQLSKAKILLALGKHGDASRLVASVMAKNDLPPQAKARAICLHAELYSSGPAPDFDKGVESYRSAIQEASKLSEDPRPAVRRVARRVLVESHLGVARCIAWGQLEGAEKASTQWSERARLLAETAISDEDIGDDIWLAVHRAEMTTHLGLMAKSNPDKDISALQLDYKRILKSAGDAAYRDRIKWEFSLAFTDASRLESARGKHRSASQLAESAWSLMADGVRGREVCEDEDFARGMLLYQLGSISAVAKENHSKAVEWYEQAIPLLEKPLSETLAGQKGIRGLALVGMGASYWETGDQKQALALSEQGAKALQEAATEGHASREALGLALGNLESMYREMGDKSAADRVAKQAVSPENSTILR